MRHVQVSLEATRCLVSLANSSMSINNNMRVATLNVRGTAQSKKQVLLKRLLLEQGIDVLPVQETKLSCDERREGALEPFLSAKLR